MQKSYGTELFANMGKTAIVRLMREDSHIYFNHEESGISLSLGFVELS